MLIAVVAVLWVRGADGSARRRAAALDGTEFEAGKVVSEWRAFARDQALAEAERLHAAEEE